MFIRKVYKTNPGSDKRYTYYRLVESYRSPQGKPRQRVILSLGRLDGVPKEKLKALADRIECLLSGQRQIFTHHPDHQLDPLAQQFYREILQKGGDRTPMVPEPDPGEPCDYAHIDLNSLEHEDVREIGAAWMCKQVLEQTGIADRLTADGVTGNALEQAMIGWISRLVYPRSEHATANWLASRSGVCELFGQRASHITRFHLYQGSLRLYARKEQIETHLAGYSRTLFDLQDKILLYDLSNTYFEGRMDASDRARHGRSKEKRSDARLISLAMVVDPWGFPKYSRFYDGNVSEPTTLGDLLDELDGKVNPDKAARPVVVIDAGLASADNLRLLSQRGYDYLCVSRSALAGYQVDPGDTTRLTNRRGQSIGIKDLACDVASKDRIFYVRSQAKARKETAMKDKLTERFLGDLAAARSALDKPRGTKRTVKVHERIGRIKEKHARVAKDYEITYTYDPTGDVVRDLHWVHKPSRPSAGEGVYFLRTSIRDLSEEWIWQTYTTLTQIEATFRILKSDLSLRPVYHQTDQNIEAHLFLGILAYHIVAIITHKLAQAGITHRWPKIVEIMDSQKILTTTFTDQSGQRRYIRQCSRPTAEARQIYDALGLKYQPFTRKKGVVTQL